MVHVKVTFFLPALPSSRLPQSLQKMREPIADMVNGVCLFVACQMVKTTSSPKVLEKKVTGNRAAFLRAAGSTSAALDAKWQAVRRARIVRPSDHACMHASEAYRFPSIRLSSKYSIVGAHHQQARLPFVAIMCQSLPP
jgi:hypothetical protein